MKTKLIVASCLSLMSAGALAQSSVTIYGVIDAGISAAKVKSESMYTRQITKHWRTGIDSGNLSASRIGIKGEEDLGGGTSAVFNLEAGFNVDNGTSGDAYSSALFGRRAVVGLKNARYGEFTLGRQDSVLSDTMKKMDPFADRQQYSNASFITYDSQLNNALVYTTPDWYGVYAKLNYAFGENVGSVKRGSFYGASLNYDANNLNVIFAYAHSDYGINMNAAGSSAILGSHATSGVQNYYEYWIDGYYPSSRNQYMMAASYDFGVVKPFVMATTSKTDAPLMAPQMYSFKEKAAKAGLTIPFGASNVIAAVGYAYIKPDTTYSKHALDYTVGYTYDFSKRTTFYTLLDVIKGKQMTSGHASFVTQHEGTAELNVGIRHRF